MKKFWIEFRCRVLHGHIMVPFGNDTYKDNNTNKHTWYMCARCLRCEQLTCIGRGEVQE